MLDFSIWVCVGIVIDISQVYTIVAVRDEVN